MKWLLDGPMLAFDVESTGISVESDRIVTASAIWLQPGTPWTVEAHDWLIAVDVEIPEEATRVHGITTVHAKEHGVPAVEALDMLGYELAKAFSARVPVVACNGCFDFTLSDREFRRNDLPTLEERLGRPIAPVVDVYVLDKYVDPYRKGGRRLENLAEFYGVKLEGAHDSSADALGAARVAYRLALRAQEAEQDPAALERLYAGWGRRNPAEIVNRLVGLGQMRPHDLHDGQVRWRYEQMVSLRAFHESKGKRDGDYNPAWPLIPFDQEPEGVPLW